MLNFLRRSVVIGCLTLVACATAPVGRKDLLDFLNDGVTLRDDVRLNLGEPSAEYEASRVLAYRLGKNDTGYVLAGPEAKWRSELVKWRDVQYNLILVFDLDGVLRRHSLVEIRSP